MPVFSYSSSSSGSPKGQKRLGPIPSARSFETLLTPSPASCSESSKDKRGVQRPLDVSVSHLSAVRSLGRSSPSSPSSLLSPPSKKKSHHARNAQLLSTLTSDSTSSRSTSVSSRLLPARPLHLQHPLVVLFINGSEHFIKEIIDEKIPYEVFENYRIKHQVSGLKFLYEFQLYCRSYPEIVPGDLIQGLELIKRLDALLFIYENFVLGDVEECRDSCNLDAKIFKKLEVLEEEMKENRENSNFPELKENIISFEALLENAKTTSIGMINRGVFSSLRHSQHPLNNEDFRNFINKNHLENRSQPTLEEIINRVKCIKIRDEPKVLERSLCYAKDKISLLKKELELVQKERELAQRELELIKRKQQKSCTIS